MAKIGRIGLIMAAQQGTKGPKEPKIDTPRTSPRQAAHLRTKSPLFEVPINPLRYPLPSA